MLHLLICDKAVFARQKQHRVKKKKAVPAVIRDFCTFRYTCTLMHPRLCQIIIKIRSKNQTNFMINKT